MNYRLASAGWYSTCYICPPPYINVFFCISGWYMNHTLASACDICPPRYYCINGDRADPCPAGSYCPGNTGLNLEQCPRGTYSPVTLLAAEAECMPCDGGYYCGETGLTAVTDQCYSGYYCREGVDTPAPDSNNTGDGGIDFV